MVERIALHGARRGWRWSTVEAPLDLVGALAAGAGPDRVVLVDCLTLWLSNLLDAGREVEPACEHLIGALPTPDGPVVFVSNEVGLGVVPGNALARRFVDHAGRLHQSLAAAATSVVVMTAGIPMHIKGPGAPPRSEPEVSVP